MGKKLHQQRRGKGSVAYRKAPGTFDISVGYTNDRHVELTGEVIELINHTGHTAPLMEILYEDFKRGFLIAPEGVRIGDKIHIGPTPNFSIGNVMRLGDIP